MTHVLKFFSVVEGLSLVADLWSRGEDLAAAMQASATLLDGLATFFQNVLAPIGEAPLAALFGLMGLTCQLLWPLFRKRPQILRTQLGIGSMYALQYALIEAWSGAGIAALGATQTMIAILAGDRPWLRKLGLIFLPLIFVVCLMTWSGLPSLCALTACSLVMLGRLQADTIRLRLFMLAAAPFGVSYDVLVGALPALCGGLLSAAIAATMLAREVRQRYREGGRERFILALAEHLPHCLGFLALPGAPLGRLFRRARWRVATGPAALAMS